MKIYILHNDDNHNTTFYSTVKIVTTKHKVLNYLNEMVLLSSRKKGLSRDFRNFALECEFDCSFYFYLATYNWL
jgi:hypothetical protein